MSARLLVRTLLVFLLSASYSPMASSADSFSLDSFNSALDHLMCPQANLDAAGKCVLKSSNPAVAISASPYHRLLRAQLVLEMAARFGAARFALYSETPEQDAIQLMASIRDTRSYLKKARDTVIGVSNKPAECARLDLQRTDLAVSLLKTVNYSTKGIKALFSGWSSPKSWITRLTAEHAEDILRGLLEDRLYLSAYQSMLIASSTIVQAEIKALPNDPAACSASGAPTLSIATELWNSTDAAIDAQCQRLAKIAGVSDDQFCKATS